MPEIKNKDGSLSAYGFACGYQEIEEIEKFRIRMYEDFGVYHVRAHHSNTHQKIVWEVFTYCKDARAYYRRLLRAAEKGYLLTAVNR